MRFLAALLLMSIITGIAVAAEWRSFISPDQKTIVVWFTDENKKERNVVLVDNGSWTLSGAKDELQGEWIKWQERLGDTSTDEFAKKVLDQERPGETRLGYAGTLYLERLPNKDVQATIETQIGTRAQTLLRSKDSKWAVQGVDEVSEAFGDLAAFFGKKPGEEWTHIVDKFQPFSSPFYAGAATAPKILVIRKGAPPSIKPPEKPEPKTTSSQEPTAGGINWPMVALASGLVILIAASGWVMARSRGGKAVPANPAAKKPITDAKPVSSYPLPDPIDPKPTQLEEPTNPEFEEPEPVAHVYADAGTLSSGLNGATQAEDLLQLVRAKIGIHNREIPGMAVGEGLDEKTYVERLFAAAKALDGYEVKRKTRESRYESEITDLRQQLHDSAAEKTGAEVRASQAEQALLQLQTKVVTAAKPLKKRRRAADKQGESDDLQQILEAADETERAHPAMDLLFQEIMSAYPDYPLRRSHDLEQDVKTIYLFQKESLDREAQYAKVFDAVQNACDAIMSRRPREYAATAVAYLLTYSATSLLATGQQPSPMLERAMLMNLSHLASQADVAVGGDQSLKALSSLATRLTGDLGAGSLEISSQTHRLARSFVDALQMINGTFQLDFSPFHVGLAADGKIQRIVV